MLQKVTKFRFFESGLCAAVRAIGLRLDLDLDAVSFSPLSWTSSRVMQRSIALTSLLALPVSRAAASQAAEKPTLVPNSEWSHLRR